MAVATLRVCGCVRNAAAAAALRKRLGGSGAYHVTFTNERIRTDREFGSVSFDRTDHDEKGNLVFSGRESFDLEKQASGFIGVR
jgi:hypothetical protein